MPITTLTDIPDFIGTYKGEFGRFDATVGGSSVTASRGKLKRLEDYSGNGNHLTQGTDAKCLVYDPSDGSIASESDLVGFFNTPAITIDNQAFSLFLVCRLMTTRNVTVGGGPSDSYQFFSGTAALKCEFFFEGANGVLATFDSFGFHLTTTPTPATPPTTKCSLIFVVSAGALTVYVNGVAFTGAANFHDATDTLNSLLGYVDQHPAHGKYWDVGLWSRALTSGEAADLHAYAVATRGVRTDVNLNLIFDGDSITYGFNGTLAESWPSRLFALRPHVGHNIAQSSILVQTLASEASTRIPPLIDVSKTNIYSIFAATNDLAFGGRTPAQASADTDTCIAAADTAGADYTLEIGMLTRGGTDADRATLRTARLAIYTTSTALAYLKSDGGTHFYYDTNTDDAAIHTPGSVHPDDDGYAFIAGRVASSLNVIFPVPNATVARRRAGSPRTGSRQAIYG